MTRAEILEAARKCVCGDREQDYGTPENSFSLIASLWTAYTGNAYTAKDVAMMLALLKVARIRNGDKADSFVDLAGYAACAGEIAATKAMGDENTKGKVGADTAKPTHYRQCMQNRPSCICNRCRKDHKTCCLRLANHCPVLECAYFEPED